MEYYKQILGLARNKIVDLKDWSLGIFDAKISHNIDCGRRLNEIAYQLSLIEDKDESVIAESLDDWARHDSRFYRIKDSIEFILAKEKHQLKKLIPTAHHFSWAVGSLKLCVRSLDQAELSMYEILKGTNTSVQAVRDFSNNISSARRNVEQILGLIRAKEIIRSIKNDKANKFLLKVEDLKKGDIILSYKTQEYLKKHFLSKLITIAAKTSMTHVSMVCGGRNNDLGMLTCAAEDVEVNGLSVEKIKPRDGEIFMVLRLKEGFDKRDEVLKSLEAWSATARNRTKDTKDKYYFSELKCWSACASGLITTTCVRFRGTMIRPPNPFHKREGMFCSEVVDVIFKEADTILVPRCEQHAIVGPSDFLYSPFFEFKGFVGSREDVNLMKKETILM